MRKSDRTPVHVKSPSPKRSPRQGVNPELLKQVDREFESHRRELTGEMDEPRSPIGSEEARDVIDPEKFGSNPTLRGAERERSRKPRSATRDQGLRGLKTLFKARVSFRNTLALAELQSPDVNELAAGAQSAAKFHSAIAASKASSEFGAAVWLYKPSD